ncbi:MAG: hypothetical protein ACYC3Q_16130, partial [Gemmatimonadaceae bacterium]
PFLREGRVNRRLWSLWQDGEVDAHVLTALAAVSCPGDAEAPRRRAFGVDPWGTAYWVRTRDGDVGRTVLVYSFGPDRRRAATGDAAHTDDITADTLVAYRRAPAHVVRKITTAIARDRHDRAPLLHT